MMKKLLTTIMAALGLGASSCVQGENVVSVNTDEFEKAITADTVQLLDVRTVEEFAVGRIAYAKNIDVNQPDFMEKAVPALDKTKKVYVYCHSGRRSLRAANMLAREGFSVVNLAGGITAWQQEGKPVEP